MNRADRPENGGDGRDGDRGSDRDGERAGGGLPWALGTVLVLAQTGIVVAVGGHWRGLGAVLVAVVTVVAIGVALAGRRR